MNEKRRRLNVLLSTIPALLPLALFSGCGITGGRKSAEKKTGKASSPSPFARNLEATQKGKDVVIYALGLVGVGYRFGGKNPEAGLDCSGMVNYIYRMAARYTLTGSAADMAKKGRQVRPETIRPGDLVFFNTLSRPRSHVAIYIGDARFVHAPSTNGQVRTDSLEDTYYRSRFEEARTYFD
ncbi:MAG: C40 family peptidase [Betaproteobacteria bacterium]|nr:C40 family peptidase [Betaproteobacteria bacterium]